MLKKQGAKPTGHIEQLGSVKSNEPKSPKEVKASIDWKPPKKEDKNVQTSR